MRREEKQANYPKSITIKNIYVLGLIDSVLLFYQSKNQRLNVKIYGITPASGGN